MTDLVIHDNTVGNTPEFTVSEVSGAVKRLIESEFRQVRIRGEVGRVSRPRSGHVYLDLKDDRNVLAAVVWRGAASNLEVQPEEGDEVVAEGRLTTFGGQSRYQMVIEQMRHAGQGALLAKLERLKVALAAEGLFAEARKRPLPYLPGVIGVITSPSGAVISDILHRLTERFPRRVLVWPVAVQGASSAGEVAAAVTGFNTLPPGGGVPKPDVLIVARGGGSVEDLWGFNDEAVIRAVASSTIPVISAVGHETDTTLIDLAADRRAPTPTAAAEMAVPVRYELAERVAGLEARRLRALGRRLEGVRQALTVQVRLMPTADALLAAPRQRLDRTGEALPRALLTIGSRKRLALAQGPAGRFGPRLIDARLARLRLDASALGARLRPQILAMGRREAAQRLTPIAARLTRAGAAIVPAARDRVDRAARLLETLSHRNTLARGFAVLRDSTSAVLTSASAVAPGAALQIELHDGMVSATADGRAAGPGKARSRQRLKGDGGQGSLF